MANVRVEAVFLDLGGTLVDNPFPRASAVAAQHLAEKTGLDAEAIHRALMEADQAMTTPHCSHYLSEMEVFEAALGRWGPEALRWAAEGLEVYRAEAWRLFRTDPNLTAMPFAELRGMLEGFKRAGIRLGVISDEREANVPKYLEMFGILDLIDAIAVSEAIGWEKPHEDMFRVPAGRLGVPPQHCVMVGDRPWKDVLGARRCGFWAVWTTQFLPRPLPDPQGLERPDAVIGHLRELPQVIKQLEARSA